MPACVPGIPRLKGNGIAPAHVYSPLGTTTFAADTFIRLRCVRL
jgi:hypothetical protein